MVLINLNSLAVNQVLYCLYQQRWPHEFRLPKVYYNKCETNTLQILLAIFCRHASEPVHQLYRALELSECFKKILALTKKINGEEIKSNLHYSRRRYKRFCFLFIIQIWPRSSSTKNTL